MSKTEELIVLAQGGDQEASQTLITENAALVWSVARRFAGRGVDLDDLYQLGCLGFVKAVSGFDPQFGTQFSTYAVPKIAGEIRRFLRDDGSVKVSRTIKEQSVHIRTAESNLMTRLGREPSIQELADETGMAVDEIAVVQAATAGTESINRPVGEDGFSLEQILTDVDQEEKMLESIALRQALDALNERENLVIRLRYYHGLTQQRTARILDVSQVQVSRIEKKALERLRQLLA